MSFFKNASLLRLPTDFQLSLTEEALTAYRLQSPGPLQVETRGFVSPFADPSGALLLTLGEHLFAVGRETRMLPGPVLARAVQTFAAEYEARTGRKPGTRLRHEFRESALADLLPRAVIQYARTLVYWDPYVRLLVVDSSSDRWVEEVAASVREAVGSFPARPLAIEASLALLMSHWLEESKLPAGFEFGHRCKLLDACDQSSCVTIAGGDLTEDAVREHVRRGFQVQQLELIFEQRIAFTLDSRMKLRRLQFLDVIANQLDAQDGADPDMLIEAEMSLMQLELRNLLQQLDNLLTFVD